MVLNKVKTRLILLIVILAFALLLIISPQIFRSFLRNVATVASLKSIFGHPSKIEKALQSITNLSERDCRLHWFHGMLSEVSGLENENSHDWEAAIRCSPGYVHLVSTVTNNRRDLAQLALDLYPNIADSWFMLAQTYLVPKSKGFSTPINENERGHVISLYQQGLELAPYKGLQWRQLGDLLWKIDPDAAIQAYLQSCYNGDPGSNGCYRAGLVAQEIGDFTAAIRYFRLSRWSGAHERANRLEVQLIEILYP